MASSNSSNSTDLGEQSPFGASGPEILAVVWLMTVLAAVFLGLRLWVKLRARKGLWWDDQLLVASWAMLVLFAATATVCVRAGLGSHIGSGDVRQTPLQLGVVVATVFSVLGAAWSKTSFAFTLLRITREGSGDHRTVYWLLWGVVVTLNIVLVFNAMVQFMWCMPAAAAWNAALHGKCWNRAVVVNYTVFAAAYSAAMDFILALVPWKVIVGLRMRLKEKVGVLVCMSLGMFAGATSIMRAITVPTLYAQDYPYEAGQLFIWTGAELATTIVAASIPILRALLSDLVHHSRYPHVMTELNTFQSLKEGSQGIRVTKTTVITRSPSSAAHGTSSRGDTESLLAPLTPDTPGPTYHSYLQK